MDALAVDRAVLAGYDWGGRAACIVAALWPQRVRGLVTVNAYNIQNISNSGIPAAPAQEHRLWYQYYFQTERGRAGLEANRRELCRLLWKLWSPHWAFDDTTFERSAVSLDNADFVDVTIHSYRHRYRNAPDDPSLDDIERQLAANRKSPCPRSRYRAKPTVFIQPRVQRNTLSSFPGPMGAACCRGSVTTRRRKTHALLPMPLSN